MSTTVIIAVIVVIIILGGLYFYFGGKPSSQTEAVSLPPPPPSANSNTLKIETLKEGTGVGAKTGDKITVHYTGMLTNGTVFDSSIPRGQPFSFTLGAGAVIQGWDQGLVGIKAGEKRKITIPSELGYGPTGYGPIPPNATLIFEVELVKIN